MMQKSTTFTTNFRLKKCYFNYDMQKTIFSVTWKQTGKNLNLLQKENIFFSKQKIAYNYCALLITKN
jgi:hypothetical protein